MSFRHYLLSATKRRRDRESTPQPEGVQPLLFAEAFRAQEELLTLYVDRQFSTLALQLRDLTLRQTDHEEHIARLEGIEDRVCALEAAMNGGPAPASAPQSDTHPAEDCDLQDQLQENPKEIEEKSYKLNNIILTGLPEDETPSLPEEAGAT